MSGFETEATKILGDRKRLERLLTIEKKRRGVQATSPVFIGMHNVAQHWWCTQYAVLKSRANEIEIFAAYLCGRITYAHRLELVTKFPRRYEELLDIGGEVTLADVEVLLNKENNKETVHPNPTTDAKATWTYEDSVDKQGNRTRLINPNLPEQGIEFYREMAKKEGVRIISPEDRPLRRGEIVEASQAEKYPTIRWNFPWSQYTVIGAPDGITTEYAYEFKTTQNRFMLKFVKPVALAQADLYGYFFHRPNKRVQIHLVEEDVTETYDEPVSAPKAEQTLTAFTRVESGMSARPPKAWKCNKCDFRATCPISQAKQRASCHVDQHFLPYPRYR